MVLAWLTECEHAATHKLGGHQMDEDPPLYKWSASYVLRHFFYISGWCRENAAEGGRRAAVGGGATAGGSEWKLVRNDVFLRDAPEHVKYVTTDPKTAKAFCLHFMMAQQKIHLRGPKVACTCVNLVVEIQALSDVHDRDQKIRVLFIIFF